jgi:hypothetical protein
MIPLKVDRLKRKKQLKLQLIKEKRDALIVEEKEPEFVAVSHTTTKYNGL